MRCFSENRALAREKARICASANNARDSDEGERGLGGLEEVSKPADPRHTGGTLNAEKLVSASQQQQE